MSRIDELIRELCPRGVRHFAVGDIATYSDSRIDSSELDESNFVGVDNLLPNKAGKANASYRPNTTRITRYDPGDVLLGNIRPYLKKIWLATNTGGCSGDVLAIRIAPSQQDAIAPAFLYYLLSSDEFFAYDMQNAKGAKMPRGSKDAILTYRIPVPPLAVQLEVVGILGKFAELEAKLEAELEAELEARRRQYAYYSSSLLSQPRGDLRRVSMGEATSRIIDHRGKTPNKLGSDWTADGHRVISALNIKNGIVDNNDHHYISNDTYSKWMAEPLAPGDVLLTSEAPLGAVAFVDTEVDWALGQRLFALRPRPGVLDGRFLYHLLRAGKPRQDLLARATGSTVSGIRQAELVKVTLELPTVDEQKRIASILDGFETLSSSLSIGLPAELVARRKQYEYYRDRLLTFEEAAA